MVMKRKDSVYSGFKSRDWLKVRTTAGKTAIEKRIETGVRLGNTDALFRMVSRNTPALQFNIAASVEMKEKTNSFVLIKLNSHARVQWCHRFFYIVRSQFTSYCISIHSLLNLHWLTAQQRMGYRLGSQRKL
jgi:hypothetical protein